MSLDKKEWVFPEESVGMIRISEQAADFLGKVGKYPYLSDSKKRLPEWRFFDSFNIGTIDDVETNGRVCVLKKRNYIFVSFRGTKKTSLKNWQTNFNFRPVPFGYNCMEVHAGFYEAYKKLHPALLKDISRIIFSHRGDPLVFMFVGHSLGGALANIAAGVFSRMIRVGVVTWGAPAVGNAGFSRFLNKLTLLHLRYEQHLDPVPAVLTVGFYNKGYLHAGNSVLVSNSFGCHNLNSYRSAILSSWVIYPVKTLIDSALGSVTEERSLKDCWSNKHWPSRLSSRVSSPAGLLAYEENNIIIYRKFIKKFLARRAFKKWCNLVVYFKQKENCADGFLRKNLLKRFLIKWRSVVAKQRIEKLNKLFDNILLKRSLIKWRSVVAKQRVEQLNKLRDDLSQHDLVASRSFVRQDFLVSLVLSIFVVKLFSLYGSALSVMQALGMLLYLFLGVKAIFGSFILSNKISSFVYNVKKFNIRLKILKDFRQMSQQRKFVCDSNNFALQNHLFLIVSLAFMIFLSSIAKILVLTISLPVLLYCGSLFYMCVRCFFQAKIIANLDTKSYELFEKSNILNKHFFNNVDGVFAGNVSSFSVPSIINQK